MFGACPAETRAGPVCSVTRQSWDAAVWEAGRGGGEQTEEIKEGRTEEEDVKAERGVQR